MNFYTSKDFLKKINYDVKVGVAKNTDFKLKGHVVVLGIGDTALDCARSAFRLGAERVSVVFRRGWQDIRCNDEIFEPSKKEGINFIPYSAPIEYTFDKENVQRIVFDKYMPN